MSQINTYLIAGFFTLSVFHVTGQEAIHNYGELQIHGEATVGFHTDLINDGDFDKNSGLAGFYGYDKSLSVSGAKNPIFHDAEIVVDNGLYLDTGIGVTNNANLITGDVITPRTNNSIFPNFIDEAFYVGENDVSLVDGYAAMSNKMVFTFPVGDDERLRPLTITSSSPNSLVKCAYFYESPNTPSTFGKSFQTVTKASKFLSVSEREFWHLDGNLPTAVTLTWDDWSNVGAFATYVSDIKVVGWHKKRKEWVNLGNTEVEGGMAYGNVTSEPFVPNEYEIITLGGNNDKLEEFTTIELDNYFMTPNGDGKNDFLVLDGLEKSPNNSIQIFDRYGILVYSKKNYQNEFNGYSNRSAVINRPSGLASGIYFYLVTMTDLKQKHQGYLYISSKVQN